VTILIVTLIAVKRAHLGHAIIQIPVISAALWCHSVAFDMQAFHSDVIDYKMSQYEKAHNLTCDTISGCYWSKPVSV